MSNELEEEVVALRARVIELEALVYVDALTGLKNRRAFDEELARELARTKRDGQPVVLLLVDVNDLKVWNDLDRDHVVGDLALTTVADALRASTREVDTVCRTGGDEFAVILHAANLGGAGIVAVRILSKLKLSPIPANGRQRRVQVSIGAASVNGQTAKVEGLRAKAEANLYEAKSRKKPGISPVVIQ